MKIRILIGIKTESGYVNVKEFSELTNNEKRDSSNKMQMQIADNIGYRKCPAVATARANNK